VLTTHPLLVPRLRMGRAIPLPPLQGHEASNRVDFTFTFLSVFKVQPSKYFLAILQLPPPPHPSPNFVVLDYRPARLLISAGPAYVDTKREIMCTTALLSHWSVCRSSAVALSNDVLALVFLLLTLVQCSSIILGM
jgi:hypothetical protein